VCPACTAIDADRYVDYLEMDAASNRSIDEIRDLIERAAYKPSVGRFKVFMIDEAHQLTKDAFNALLKTLEEPPEYLKFVLATTDPERMLPTVLSRCLQFNLRPMSPEVVQEHLAHVLDAEGIAHDEQALRLLGRAAHGSMRDALSLTDQAIAYGGGQLEGAAVRAMLGLVGDAATGALLAALAERDGAAVVAHAEAMRTAGVSPASALEQMARRVQQAAVLQAAPQASPADEEEASQVRGLAAALAPDELQLLYSILVHGRQELSLMSDAHAAFVMVLLRWLAFAADELAQPTRGRYVTSPAAPVPGAGAGAALAAAPMAVNPGPREAALRGPSFAATAVKPLPARLAAGEPASFPVPGRTSSVLCDVVGEPATEPDTEASAASAKEPVTGPASQALVVPRAEAAAETADAPALVPASEVAIAAAAAEATHEPAATAEPAEPAEATEPAEPAEPAESVEPAESAESAASAESSSTAPASRPPPQPEVGASQEGDAAALANRWDALVREPAVSGALAGLARELAWQSVLAATEPGDPPVWRLTVAHDALCRPALQDKLEQALAAQLGQRVRLALQTGPIAQSPSQRDALARERRQQAAEAEVQGDPLVQGLLARFPGARLIPGSIRPVGSG
jgi:DNA polymerase-3 subunit gamma/tau